MASLSEMQWPSIPEFYAQRDVFITGATGFMGKCLVEKLLRSLPDIGRLLILVRRKKGKSEKERIDDMLSSKAFDNLRSEQPAVFEKLVPVAGNMIDPGLGLSENDLQLVTESVSIVFHLAATTRFDSPLREALRMNVLGVQKVISLCRKMKKLVSLVHVSTAYAHCNRWDLIEEIVYPPKVYPDKLLSLLDWMTDEQLELLTPTLLDGRPNTYTFSKALAEYLLVKEGKGLPIAIYRPSIVSAGYKEPLPGWTDTFNGVGGIFITVGKGILRVLCGTENAVADLVPVDYVNNMLISVGWMTALNHSTQPIVYHFTSGTVNPIEWINMYPIVIRTYEANPFDQVIRRPHFMKCRPTSFWPFWSFVLHIIPGFLMDVCLQLVGKKPFMVKLYRRLHNALENLHYFILNEWRWSHRNCDKLYSLMSEEDKVVFNFDLRKLDWEEYIRDVCLGTKKFLLKEDPANIPVARKQITRLRNMRYTFNLLMLLLATRILYIRSRIARKLWHSVFGFCLQMLAKLGLPLLQLTM